MGLTQELKRRKVFRFAAMYLVGAWIAIQVAGEAFEAWGIPDSMLRFVWLAAIVGFPLALVLGWRYDIVAGRIIRTPAVDRESSADLPLQRADYIFFAVLLAVIGVLVIGLLRTADRLPVVVASDAAAPPKSIAVLPFANLSGNESALPFTVGIHDDILTHISKIGDLKVISRTSVVRLDPTTSIREIGRLLNVGTVLEGGVQLAGDQLRINVQLIDAGNDAHLWAETFDKELTTQGIFEIQTDIAVAVARALETTLSSREQKSLRQIPTSNMEAYEAYLLGKQRISIRTVPSLEKARTELTAAVHLDPDFALAQVALADAILLLNNYGNLSLEDAVEEADALLGSALELDPELGAAHASMGLNYARQGRTNEAIAAFERAIALDPNYAPAYNWFGDLLINQRSDFDRALSLLEAARALDPLSPVINSTLGEIYEGLGKFDLALAQFEKTIDIEPDYVSSYFQIALLQRYAFGRIDKGIRWHMDAIRRDPARQEQYVGFAYLDIGDEERAAYWINRAYDRHPEAFWTVAGKTLLHLYRHDFQTAAEHAEALEQIAPGNNFSVFALLTAGENQRVLEIFEEQFPDFDCNASAVDRGWVFSAINVSLAMERAGDTACAVKLLDEALDVVRSMPRLGSRGHGIADVEIYARQGRTEFALAALQEAVNEGWRSGWWIQGQLSPHNANIADDPRFDRLIQDIRNELDVQLENVRQMEASGELIVP